ncbi:MAG: MFS transporter [Firmicutes bacterium]|nr:MFS transporter [Bacillota bacterium]
MQLFWKTRAFWALALGLFLNAYVYGVAALSLEWIPHPRWFTTLALLWSPLGLSVGIALGGWLSDHWGRRLLLLGAPVGYLLGSLLLLSPVSLLTPLLAAGLLMITAGIDSNTILVYTQELVPPEVRRQTLYAELNFVNLGGVALAGLASVMGNWGPTMLRLATTLLPAILAASSFALRQALPESSRWEQERRTRIVAPRLPALFPIRLLTAILFSFSNTAGFSLMTYALGAEFFPRHFHHIMLISTLTAFAVGLTARWLGRIPAKHILVAGYGLTTLSGWALAQTRTPAHGGFWPALISLSALTSVTYLAEDTFKVDAWPSAVRGRFVALVRIISLLLYVMVVLAVGRARLERFLTIMVLSWGTGLAAAVMWWIADTSLFEHQGGISRLPVVHWRRRRSKRRP